MNPHLQDILWAYSTDPREIYDGLRSNSSDQIVEIALRERVAGAHYSDYLLAISRSHSIPVMDREVDNFLAKMPQGSKQNATLH